ncbi:MAG: hypothetical protein H7177_10125 [Rhizobacter sp.]|nr:hypothetical protein [Bacteriovorax sp.]
MKALLIFSILATTSLFSQAKAAQATGLNDDIQRDITEGKIQATETLWLKDLDKSISEKQQKALALITLVAAQANDRYSAQDDSKKEDAEYAHVGFVARFQDIREGRESLERKEIQPDYATLQDYSKRLDSLNQDLQSFLK